MSSALKFAKTYDILFLIVSFFVFFLLRLPSLFEPHWYGDEGIYQVIGEALNKGSLLYRDVWDNKPPLLYLLYALFNSDQYTLKLVSLFFGLLSIVVFFFLSKRLFHQQVHVFGKIHFLTTSIFVFLLGLPLLEGNIANAENFMMLPILLAALLIFPRKPEIFLRETIFKLFFAGILLGLAFLFKVVAIFDLLAFLGFLLIINLPHRLKPSVAFPLVVGFFSPILITVFYFWIQDAFIDFARATFSSNIGYVAWQNKLIFPQGILLFKTTLLIIAVVLIVSKRKSLNISAIFILLWFAFSLYNAFFAQRPYTHYLLTLLPSFTLIIGLIFWEKKYKKAIALFLILAFVLVFRNFNLYGKTIGYYQNFVSFVTGWKSVVSYREFFDKRTPIDYEIASFLKYKIREKDSIFIWGDNAQVYKLVGVTPPGKYIAFYHVIDSKDGMDSTKFAIEKEKPRFIIIMPGKSPLPIQLIGYLKRINIDKVSIYERFF